MATLDSTAAVHLIAGLNGDSAERKIARSIQIYYDSTRQTFWARNDRNGWIMIGSSDVRRRLKQLGYRNTTIDGERLSQVDLLLIAIQECNDVDYADSLAGFKSGIYMINEKRILVRDSPRLIDPVQGDWRTISHVLRRMLGRQQQRYLFGWLKIALLSLYEFRHRYGQALVLAGVKDCGKSLIQGLFTKMFGDRCGKPHRYMCGETTFNSELMGCEHLVIEDERPSTDIRARRNFGCKIKEICANEFQSAHGKNRIAVTLPPLRRLSISVNDEPENLLILPPIDPSISDKLIILKCNKHPMPMPTLSNDDREKFIKQLHAELPHFIHFLMHWDIPEELVSQRYGITHFHHPDILESISAMAPETRLAELIDAELFSSPAPSAFEGSANLLERKLTSVSSGVKREAERLFTFPTACGTYLGRLRDDKRYSCRHTEKGNVWTIIPPG
jgi:hypothetical protein